MCISISSSNNIYVDTKKISEINNEKSTNSLTEEKDPPNDDKTSKLKKSEIKKGTAIKEISFTENTEENRKTKKDNFSFDDFVKGHSIEVIPKEPSSNSSIQEKQDYKKQIVNRSAGILKTRVKSRIIKEFEADIKNKNYIIPHPINNTVVRPYSYESKEFVLNNKPTIKFRFDNNMSKNIDINSVPKLNAKDYGKDKAFFYVNGMVTDEKTAKNTGKELEEILGNKVNVIHNPTNGGLSDFVESLGERHNIVIPGITKGMIKGTTFDDITLKTANKFLDQINKGKELKIVCHSQGGAITSNALEYAKQKLLSDGKSEKEIKNIFSKIEVITLGAASSPDKFPEGVKIVQVSHPKDPVPKVAGGDLSNEKDKSIKHKPNIETQEAKINTSSTDIFSFIDRFDVAVDNLKKTLIDDNLDRDKRMSFGKHSVSGEYQSYLSQSDTRSLLYNFGRQDFQ